ncbi:hypothetical protein F5884DRAFT_863258 [Xylogone sp. PMI_703]|nr:hypothetical protein F5884DRAFT_863258 [Xylogone sp. PMI_703]
MAPQRTLKERNTQRRKRRRTLESKAAEIAELCDFDMALIMRNCESGEYYTYRSRDSWRPNMEEILADPKSQNKLPRDIEKLKKKKQRLKRARRYATSKELISEDQMSNKDGSDGRITRAASFLPEPPSFDGLFSGNHL